MANPPEQPEQDDIDLNPELNKLPDEPEQDEPDELESEPAEVVDAPREVDKFIADPKLLRQAQLNTYKGGKAQVIDGNEPGDTEKKYRNLSKIWMPLILDVIGKIPWTVEEVIEAMKPLIKRWANEYGRHRGGYQPDDAESDGVKAVFQALEKDGGRSPFALFCARTIKRAIQRGEKGASIIPIPHRERLYSDKSITSMDAETGTEATSSMSGSIPSDIQSVSRTSCPACSGNTPFGTIKDDETGETVKCPVCKGRGSILVGGRRTDSGDPEERVIEKRKLAGYRTKLSSILHMANLSPRQIEIILLRFGLEGAYDSSIQNTDMERDGTAIARVLANADTILYRPYVQKDASGKEIGISNPTGIWVEAERQGKTDLFQQIWAKAFQTGSLQQGPQIDSTGKEFGMKQDEADEIKQNIAPFDPEIPASLQIAPLADRYADATPLQGTKGKTGESSALDMLIKELQTQIAPNIKISTKSKQFARNQYDTAMNKITNLTKIDYKCKNCGKRWTTSAASLKPEPQCENCGSTDLAAAEQSIANALVDTVKFIRSNREVKECLDSIVRFNHLLLLDEQIGYA